jgi:alcohol dehydrogenase class IV
MDFNAPGLEPAFQRMAQSMNVTGGDAASLVSYLFDLNEQLGLPENLAAIGVKEEHLETLASLAEADFCHPNNPKPVSREDFLAIYKKAL